MALHLPPGLAVLAPIMTRLEIPHICGIPLDQIVTGASDVRPLRQKEGDGYDSACLGFV